MILYIYIRIIPGIKLTWKKWYFVYIIIKKLNFNLYRVVYYFALLCSKNFDFAKKETLPDIQNGSARQHTNLQWFYPSFTY